MSITGQQTIFREKSKRYTKLPNAIATASDMSFAAKGVLAYLLSKPDDWILRPADIEKHGTGGQHSIRVALKELRALGYLQLTKITSGGIIREWQWLIADHRKFSPKPDVEFPHVVNQRYTKTDLSNGWKPKKRRSHSTGDPLQRDPQLADYRDKGTDGATILPFPGADISGYLHQAEIQF